MQKVPVIMEDLLGLKNLYASTNKFAPLDKKDMYSPGHYCSVTLMLGWYHIKVCTNVD